MSEQKLTRSIIDCINASGLATVWRNQSGKVPTRGGFIQLSPEGLPDVIGYSRAGRFVGLEVKLPGEEPTSIQLDWMFRIRSAGGIAAVVVSQQEAITALSRERKSA